MEDKREQEIKEFANDIHEVSMKVGKELVEKIRYNLQAKNETIHINSSSYMQAEELNKLGYRKQSEVAKEIINKLQKINEEEIKTGNALNFSARRLLILLIEKLAKEYGVWL